MANLLKNISTTISRRDTKTPQSKVFLITIFFLIGSTFFSTRFEWTTTVFKANFYQAKTLAEKQTFALGKDRKKIGFDQAYYKGEYYSAKAPGVSYLMVPSYIFFAKPAKFILKKLSFSLRTIEQIQGLICHFITFGILMFFGLQSVIALFKAIALKNSSIPIAISLAFLATLMFPFSNVPLVVMYCGFLSIIGIEKFLSAKTVRDYILSGTVIGAMFLVAHQSVLLSVVPFLLLVYRREFKFALIFCMTVSAFVFVQLLTNYILFDSVFSFPIHHFYPNGDISVPKRPRVTLVLPEFTKLFEMTFSISKGIFLHSPILIFSIPGILAIRRINKDFATIFTGSAIIMFIFFLFYSNWAAGAVYGFRQYSSYLFFLSIPASYWLLTHPFIKPPLRFLAIFVTLTSMIHAYIIAISTTWIEPKFLGTPLKYCLLILEEKGARNIFSTTYGYFLKRNTEGTANTLSLLFIIFSIYSLNYLYRIHKQGCSSEKKS